MTMQFKKFLVGLLSLGLGVLTAILLGKFSEKFVGVNFAIAPLVGGGIIFLFFLSILFYYKLLKEYLLK